jgi:hypothetical protein
MIETVETVETELNASEEEKPNQENPKRPPRKENITNQESTTNADNKIEYIWCTHNHAKKMIDETYSDLACELKGNIFDLKKLHHLKMVHNNTYLEHNKYYWIVYSPGGIVLCNLKTKIQVIEVFPSTSKEQYIMVEFCVMDGNYTFRHIIDGNEYTFFEV